MHARRRACAELDIACAQGHLKAAPTVVPEKNPVSGQPNAFYGWSTPAQTAAKAENATHEE